MGGTRILVVEDDADINEVVCTQLTRRGYTCVPAYSGSEARMALDLAAAAGEPYGLVVTDLMLPGVRGEELVAGLRASGAGAPIIVISARGSVDDRVALLRMGADDYLVKPFDLNELSARVEAQLRGRGLGAGRGGGDADTAGDAAGGGGELSPRHNVHVGAGASTGGGASSTRHNVLVAGRWTMDVEAHSFLVDGEPVTLTNIEFAIVELLLEHPDTVFTRQQVYELCWGEPYVVDDNTVTAHISKIRAKLRPTGTEGYIRTVWGLGVKLAVPR